MSRSALKTLYILFAVVAGIAIAIAKFQQMTTLLICIGLATIVISLVFLYFLRCPHCGRWPRKGDFFARYCSGCGEPLDG